MGTVETRARPRILMLDDEADLIHALRRVLRSSCPQFDIEYFTTPKAALERLEAQEFDVLVTDMRMPETDGAEFLRRAMAYSPGSVRFVLSGQADERTIIRCLPYTHQHIAKPCDVTAVVKRITSVTEAHNSRIPPAYQRALVSMKRLPVRASVLKRLREELSSASPSLMVLGECIASDPSLSVKLLQLTSSSFFGHPDSILSPAKAAARLGLDILRKVVFNADVFEDLVLSSAHAWLESSLEQAASDALFDSALEETLSVAELSAKIAARCKLIGTICLAHHLSLAGSEGDASHLERIGPAATAYLLRVLGLPTPLFAAQVEGQASPCSPESTSGALYGK